MKRKFAPFLIIVLSILYNSCCLIDMVGGNFSKDPEKMYSELSPGARQLIIEAVRDLNTSKIADYHIHILGIQKDVTGCFVNQRMKTWFYPLDYIRYLVFLSSSGIKSPKEVDGQYVKRLVKLIRSSRYLSMNYIMAFDKYYNRDGTVNLDKTAFYVSNEYMYRLAEEYPDIFIPVISVHPYRPDGLIELEKWAKKRVKYIKWLPNAMGMNPSDERIVPFYKMMKKYNMVLICHVGKEEAVTTAEDELGNPLLLRKPLDIGVRVIACHCASNGKNIDLDNPERGEVTSFELFMRLMSEKKYEGLLFGDISATTLFNRIEKPLITILRRQDLHKRLVNGSDYPLPGVNFVIQTRKFSDRGFLSDIERGYLNEIYDYNPLLFDLVLKRTIRVPGTDLKFSKELFEKNPGLP